MTHGRILQTLKDGTAAQHEAVERRMNLDARLSDTGSYAGLLAALYGFYAPLEDALAAVGGYGALGIDFDRRRKAARLAADLVALGRDPAAVPRWAAPRPGSLGCALGCMYVLEGATLGGRYVRREVEARLGLTAARGCAFFASYGDQVGPMWTQFRAALVAHAGTAAVEGEVVAAALDTFAALDRWLAAGPEGTP
jgi:heme oxygenase